jgi:hypothetical protein
MVYRRFYSEVGKLLYAIASANGLVNKQEYRKLRDIVEQKLVPAEHSTDQFGTDSAFYAEIEFDILLEQSADSTACFNSFCNYVEAHRTAFDAHLKAMTMNLTKELALVYHGNNAKEAEMIKTLKKRLDAIFKEK